MKPSLKYTVNSTADWLAPPMFVLALLFLFLVASLIVVWVDIPRVDFMSGVVPVSIDPSVARDQSLELAGLRLGGQIANLVFIVWSIFVFEFLFAFFSINTKGRSFWKSHAYGLLACFLPPLRMAAPCHSKGGRIWLPRLGWRMPGRRLSKALEKNFSKPMLLIAMLILPVLVVEFGMPSYVNRYLWLRVALHVSTGLIWIAFSVEFIIRLSATHRKWQYVKKNWIDLAIVVLPLVSFLRSFRIVRAIKLAKFAKAQQLARIGRIYRLRSLALKAVRALILFEFFHRFFKIKPERKLAALRSEYRERKADLDELKLRIDQLVQEVKENQKKSNPTSEIIPISETNGESVIEDC